MDKSDSVIWTHQNNGASAQVSYVAVMLISRKIDLQKYRYNVYLESEFLLLSNIVDDVAL